MVAEMDVMQKPNSMDCHRHKWIYSCHLWMAYLLVIKTHAKLLYSLRRPIGYLVTIWLYLAFFFFLPLVGPAVDSHRNRHWFQICSCLSCLHGLTSITLWGLEDHLVHRHGIPYTLASDQRTFSIAQNVGEWAQELGIYCYYHTPHHPEAIG